MVEFLKQLGSIYEAFLLVKHLNEFSLSDLLGVWNLVTFIKFDESIFSFIEMDFLRISLFNLLLNSFNYC